MIRSRPSVFWLLPVVALVVVADECAKRFALASFPDESAPTDAFLFRMAVHKNWGIAFDLPFQMTFVIVATTLIAAALLWVAYREARAKPLVSFAALTIIIGATGNLYDRVVYGFTVDYLILFGRSAINVSDMVIVAGVVLMLYASRERGHGHRHGHAREAAVPVDKAPRA